MKQKFSLIEYDTEIASQWHPTKNGHLTPDQVAFSANKKVWWKCQKGHEWEAGINNRTNLKSGCPYCSGRYAIHGETDLATVNPALAAEWHPTKNDSLTPEMVTSGSAKKVWWFGPCGHEWKTSINNRAKRKSNCPYCARTNTKPLPGFNDLATTRPELAKQWHPTKNGSLTPTQVTKSSHKKIWWQCKEGHEWEATIASRSKGTNCPICNIQRQEK